MFGYTPRHVAGRATAGRARLARGARRVPPGRRRVVPPALPGRARPRRRRAGWSAIASGTDTLIAAPDRVGQDARRLPRRHRPLLPGGRTAASVSRGTDVVYVSPLRALTVDVSENLAQAARGDRRDRRRARLRRRRTSGSRCATATRRASERAAMLRDRPEIVVTTPESLYLLAHRGAGRELLGTVRHGHRRRDPRARPGQARLAPRAHASSGSTASSRSPAAVAAGPDRLLGDAAPDRD